jgi:hypothetical protein
VQSPGIWNDIDTPEQAEQARSVQTIIRPNAAVITGTHPYMRVQNWFKATEPIVNAELVKSLNKRIHKLYGGDQTVINPSRLMRLPGTIAWPWKKDRTTPELTIFVLPPASDPRPLSYPLSMLTSQLPGEQGDTSRPEAPGGARSGLNTAADLMRLIRAGDNWHNHMIQLVAHWIGRGWSNAEILAAAESFTLPEYTQNATLAEVGKAIKGGREKWAKPDPEDFVSDAGGPDPRPDLECSQLPYLGRTKIPPRRWAYGRFLLFGQCACLAAVDGGGKGAQAVGISLSHITGEPLLGEKVWRTGPVAIITYEDDQEEWHRRIAAACEHHQIDYETAIAGFYFIHRPRERIVFAAMGDRGVIYPDGDEIVTKLRECGAVLLIVDPLNHAHSFEDGNSNAMMAKVAAEMNRITADSGVAGLVLHHLRKGSTGQVDDMMGATAIRATFRSSRVMMRMATEEAEKLGIKDGAWRYSRISGSKENYAPPPDKARWFRLASVTLGNGTGEYPDGDEIGVAITWECRPMFKGMDADKLKAVFETLRTGTHSPVRQAKNWAGKVLSSIGERSVAEATHILGAWITNGVLTEGEITSNRNTVRKVILNEAMAEEILASISVRFELPD